MANYSDSALAEFLRYQRMRAQESNKKRITVGTMQSWESAEQLAQFDAAAARLQQLASLTELQQQFLALVLRIDSTATPAPAQEPAVAPVRYRTGEQFERITKLLNHHTFTKADRTKGLLKLNKLQEAEAAAYIAELEVVLPSAEQIEQIEVLLTCTSSTEADYEQGRQKLSELNRAGAATYLVELQKWATELNASPTASATPAIKAVPQAQRTASTHPALAASPYDQARAAYLDALKNPCIKSEERDTAMTVIDDWNEVELRSKTAGMLKLIQQRENAPITESVAA